MRNFSKLGINVLGRTSGKIKTTCPWCSGNRKHPNDKSLSVNLDTGLYKCHNCQVSGYVPDEDELRRKQQEREERRQRYLEREHRNGRYKLPAFNEKGLDIPPQFLTYLTEQRGITLHTLRQFRVTVERHQIAGTEKQAIVFNYFEQGVLINQKYRTLEKQFAMYPNAELIPYNVDSLLDADTCCICEGEIDAMTLVQCGFNATISVPSGGMANLSWMDRFVESHFDDKRSIILCMDADTVGRRLQAELSRRLGEERCRVVRWSEGCKDANDELMQHGAESVRRCVNAAEELPMSGTFTATDTAQELRSLFINGMQHGADTGWSNLDEKVSFEPGRFVVVTGRPGEGKSEWIDELVLRLCIRHEWRIAYFSPENMPIILHQRKLVEKLTGYPFEPAKHMTDELYQRCTDWLSDNVTHILPDDEDGYTLDNILKVARQLVARRGVRILVLDPLNRIEQKLEQGQTELQYLSSLLNRLVRFAQQQRVLVILVAHPRKVNRNERDGRKRRVEMNDINGSADFGNKADYCFIVDRDDDVPITTVYIDKVRFKHLGNRGEARFHYDILTGRYVPATVQAIPDPLTHELQYIVKSDFRNFNVRWI